jgi:uncharacterized glyoxalase superfamily protein PhnB
MKQNEAAMANTVEIQAELGYRDPKAALEWLERAFGFEPTLIVTGSDGIIVHAHLEMGGAVFAIGRGESPASLGGNHSQVHVRFKDPIQPHYERALKAGAKIIDGPTRQFYGDITYVAADLEGHIWRFGQLDAMPPTAPPAGWNVKGENA